MTIQIDLAASAQKKQIRINRASRATSPPPKKSPMMGNLPARMNSPSPRGSKEEIKRKNKKPSLPSKSLVIPASELRNIKPLFISRVSVTILGTWKDKEVIITEFDSPRYYEEFINSIDRICALDSPKLAKVYGMCPTRRKGASISESISGQSLAQRLLTGKIMSWRERIGIAKGVAEALDFLHSYQPPWIQRDLNPAHIFITPDQQIKLNVVKTTQDTTCAMDHYIPEYKDHQEATEKGDIFCYGLLLSLLTSTKKYNEKGLPLPETVNLPATTPTNYVKLVRSCLDEKPPSRPSAHEIIEILDTILQIAIDVHG